MGIDSALLDGQALRYELRSWLVVRALALQVLDVSLD